MIVTLVSVLSGTKNIDIIKETYTKKINEGTVENATKLMKLWSQNMVAEFTRFISIKQESEFNCGEIHCADWAR